MDEIKNVLVRALVGQQWRQMCAVVMMLDQRVKEPTSADDRFYNSGVTLALLAAEFVLADNNQCAEKIVECL